MRITMLRKLKQALAVINLKPNNIYTPTFNIIQEDQRDTETRKRINKFFDEQEAYILTSSIVPHEINCVDEIQCIRDTNGKGCYKWEPDKIVNPEHRAPKFDQPVEFIHTVRHILKDGKWVEENV